MLTPGSEIVHLADWLTHVEVAEDPTDRLASHFRQMAEHFAIADQHFYGLYLAFHGGLKLVLMLLLWARRLWAYPLAMAVLALFVIYEASEFVLTGSPFLAALSGLDLAMIGLVWKEWRVLRAMPAAPSA